MKPYRPWHTNMYEPKEPLIVKVISWVIVTLLIWTIVILTFMAIDKQAMIDEAYDKGQREMRLHILNANKDIIKENDAYIKHMDDIIEKEYRRKR